MKLEISKRQAADIYKWLTQHGGVNVWKSINLANPLGQWYTSVCNSDIPSWQAAETPILVTNISDVFVIENEEVMEPIKLEIGRSYMKLSFEIKRPSAVLLETALARAGNDAYYEIDFDEEYNHIARVFKPRPAIPLKLYIDEH